MQRTLRPRLSSMADATGAGSVIRVVRRFLAHLLPEPIADKTFE